METREHATPPPPILGKPVLRGLHCRVAAAISFVPARDLRMALKLESFSRTAGRTEGHGVYPQI